MDIRLPHLLFNGGHLGLIGFGRAVQHGLVHTDHTQIRRVIDLRLKTDLAVDVIIPNTLDLVVRHRVDRFSVLLALREQSDDLLLLQSAPNSGINTR